MRKTMVGETRTMNNGMKATVIGDNGGSNLVIEFEDGSIVCNKTKDNFLKGCIKNPNIETEKIRKYDSILGQTRIMNNGMKATVIADRGFNEIVIQFEDGTIVFDKTRGAFFHGNIRNPNVKNLKSYIGETRVMNNGEKATVIADRGKDDIDIQFEDGTIVCNKSRRNFRVGRIGNPNVKKRKILTSSLTLKFEYGGYKTGSILEQLETKIHIIKPLTKSNTYYTIIDEQKYEIVNYGLCEDGINIFVELNSIIEKEIYYYENNK